MVWTTGTWTVKPGREDDFIAGWSDFARWSAVTFGGDRAWLLRERDQPGVFVTMGAWPSDEVIAAWRGSLGFRLRFEAIRELVLSFEPRTLDEVVEISGNGS